MMRSISSTQENEPSFIIPNRSLSERFLGMGTLGRFAVKTIIIVGAVVPAFTWSAERVIDHSRKPVADSFALSVKPQIDSQGAQLKDKLDARFDSLAQSVNKISGEVDGAVADVNQFKEDFETVKVLLRALGLPIPTAPPETPPAIAQAAPEQAN